MRTVKQEVIRRIAHFSGRSETGLSLKDNLRKGLSLDSLDFVELNFSLEEYVGYDIPESESEKWETVEDVIQAIQKKHPSTGVPETIRTAKKITLGDVSFGLEGRLEEKDLPTEWWFRFKVKGDTQAVAAQKLIDMVNQGGGE